MMSKSNLEEAFLHHWRTHSGLSTPEREYCFARVLVGDAPHPPARRGIRKRLERAGLHDWRFDFAWPSVRVAVEVDGGQWVAHGGRHNRDGDREKLNAAARHGWRVLRYSGSMLQRDPLGIVGEIKATLAWSPEGKT